MTPVYILAAILIFGVLIAVHELGHFLAAKACGVQVNEFSIGMGPAVWSGEKGGTQYSLRLLPIGGFCAMEGEEGASDNPHALNRQGFWKQFIIFVAGAAFNFLTGLLILLVIYSGAKGFYVPEITGFAPEFPLRGEDGLIEGDLLRSINGERIYLYSDVSLLLNLSGGGTVDLEVLRGGEAVTLRDLPLTVREYTSADGETKYSGYGLYFSKVEEGTPLTRARTAWYQTMDFVRTVRLSLQMLARGDAGFRDLSGPVGIVSTITEVGEQSASVRDAVENILFFAALIAVNLAVMNLLPIPALDGGRVLFLVLDALAMLLVKRRIPEKYQNAINMGGFAVLMGFMLVVTFSDVFKLIR